VLAVPSVVVLSAEVVEEGAAVVEEGAADVDNSSEVIVASALAVVFAFVAVVFTLVSLVFVACLFLKSSRSSAPLSLWHSCANVTASTAAFTPEHPPPTKHCSISSKDSRSTPLPRHAVIDFKRPQVVLETSSLRLFCAHSIPDAETIAAPAKSARRKDRILASETNSGERQTSGWSDCSSRALSRLQVNIKIQISEYEEEENNR
jgi:hypothetical protein